MFEEPSFMSTLQDEEEDAKVEKVAQINTLSEQTKRTQSVDTGRTISVSSPDYVWTVYRKRWAILLAFFFLNFFQCLATICVTAFMTEIATAYQISNFEANMVNSTSAILFLPAFIVATTMYNSISLRKVLLICSFLILIGAWMRVMLAYTGNFWWLIAGQTVIGISSPITTGGVSIIANFWFADNERGIATSLMMVSNPLGFFVSFLFQAYYGHQIDIKANGLKTGSPGYNAVLIQEINQLLIVESALTTLGMLYFWIVFRTSRPEQPPSLAATRRKQSITQGMWSDTKVLFANRNFVLVMLSFSLIYAIYGTFGFVLNNLLEPFTYTPTAIALIAMITVLSGTVAAVLTGKFLDKTNKYHFSMKMQCIATAFAMGASIYLFGTETLWGGAVFAVIGGAALTPAIPINFQLATECTHPVQPALVTGLLMCMAQVLMIFENYGYLYILSPVFPYQQYRSQTVLAIMAATALLAFAFALCVREDLRRMSSILDISIASAPTTPKLIYR